MIEVPVFTNDPPLTWTDYEVDGETILLSKLDQCPEPFVGVEGGEYAAIYETCLGVAEAAIERVSLWESWAQVEIRKQSETRGRDNVD